MMDFRPCPRHSFARDVFHLKPHGPAYHRIGNFSNLPRDWRQYYRPLGLDCAVSLTIR